MSGIFPGKHRVSQWGQDDHDRYSAAVAAGYEPDEPCPACKSVTDTHDPGCRYYEPPMALADVIASIWEPARTNPAAVAAARERTAS